MTTINQRKQILDKRRTEMRKNLQLSRWIMLSFIILVGILLGIECIWG